MYRAYYGPAGCGPLPPLTKDRHPFREFPQLDEALSWACSVTRKGTSVLAIEGDDGTQLTRSEIAVALRDSAPLTD
jgi:hypothetical protein